MINTLLVGGNGYIGNQILRDFQKKFSVKVLGRGIKSTYVYDLSSSIPEINEKFDLVIHNAAKAHLIPHSSSEIMSIYNINYNGTVNLLKSLEINAPENFIYISTVAVYGLTKGINITEEAPLLAKDAYGKSKLLAENAVVDWCKNKNVKCTILRLPLVVGKNAPGNLGAMIQGIKRGYYFNIGDGAARKSMILNTDIPRVIEKAIGVEGVFNLSDGYHPSFKEISTLIGNVLGRSVHTMPTALAKVAAKFGDIIGNRFPLNSDILIKLTEDLTFDNTKAKLALNWEPTPVLEGFEL